MLSMNAFGLRAGTESDDDLNVTTDFMLTLPLFRKRGNRSLNHIYKYCIYRALYGKLYKSWSLEKKEKNGVSNISNLFTAAQSNLFRKKELF